MNDDIKTLIFEIGVLVFLGVGVIFIAHLFIQELKKRKRDYEALDKPIKKSDLTIQKVTVFSKCTDTVYSGSWRNPTHRIGFFVTFLTKDGKKLTFDVGKSKFRRIKKNSQGNLATSDGEFIDFK